MKIAVIMAIAIVTVLTTLSFAESKSEYWDNGKIRITDKYNSEGEVTGKTYYDHDGDKERQEKYNDRGKKVSLAYFNKQGKLKTGIDGWAGMQWKYSDGKMIGEGYYGSDGKLQEYKKYNEEGDLIDKKYFGGVDPVPSEEYEPIPDLAGENIEYYDKEGNKEGSTGLTYDDPFFPYMFSLDEWSLEDQILERE